jgi:ABC-2 type transport system permease protein
MSTAVAGRPLGALSRAHSREMLRDRKTAAGAVGIPAVFLALFVAIAVVSDDSPDHDLLRRLLPMALFFVFGSLIFFGTVSPTVDLRSRGTLRLLSSTPLRPSTFLLALAPARLVLAASFIAVTAAVSAAFGLLPTGGLPSLVVTCACGVAFLLALGFLLAARLTGAETASNLLSLVLVVLLFLAGGLVPLSSLPASVADVLGWLPPALLYDGLASGLVGEPAVHPAWAGWAVLLLCAVLLGGLAVRSFRWDRATDS